MIAAYNILGIIAIGVLLFLVLIGFAKIAQASNERARINNEHKMKMYQAGFVEVTIDMGSAYEVVWRPAATHSGEQVITS